MGKSPDVMNEYHCMSEIQERKMIIVMMDAGIVIFTLFCVNSKVFNHLLTKNDEIQHTQFSGYSSFICLTWI